MDRLTEADALRKGEIEGPEDGSNMNAFDLLEILMKEHAEKQVKWERAAKDFPNVIIDGKRCRTLDYAEAHGLAFETIRELLIEEGTINPEEYGA